MTATIWDVARRAGVSVATVSRALNRSGPVREETRRRIEEAARELNYAPNSAARSLISRRTGMLGVLLPDLFGEFFSELIRGIDGAAQGRGYHLLVSSSHDAASEIEAALRGMRGRVDGLVVMAPMVEAAVLKPMLPRNVPVVLLNSPLADGAFDTLTVDNYGGAREVVAHLLSHGHQRVAILKGPERNHDAEERLRGYRAALAEAGVPWREELEIPGDFTGESGYRGAEAVLRMEPRPTAIFAANDAMAFGALSALRDAGVAVPEEMALAGFDDVSSTRYTIPPLTTAHVAIRELGARAVGMLADALVPGAGARPRPRPRETLPATLVVRRSCGCTGAEGGRPRPIDPSARGERGSNHTLQEDAV